ncbi:GNAT family N-acetyltransferase [Hamadaea sp. NPDC050747]|uniref:GNAT family N-acetyltransferase n=1 Tax=Hamadaea sp. NPDC050747 TaxID=3155789 RepID=UPI0033D01B62
MPADTNAKRGGDVFSVCLADGRHSIDVFTDIKDVPLSHWPSTTIPSSVYPTGEWLDSQQGWNTPTPVYAVLRRTSDDSVAAAVSCFLAEQPDQVRFDNVPRMLLNVDHPRDLAGSLDEAEASVLRERAASLRDSDALPYPALVVTAANAAMFGYATTEAESPLPDAETLAALADGIDVIAERLGAPTRAFWYVRPADFPDFGDELVKKGYARTLINADSRLDIAWNSLDEYVAWLPRSRRYDVKREIRAFREAGYRVTVDGGDAIDERLSELYAGLQRRFGFPAEPGAVLAGFQRVRERLDAKMRVFVARDGDEPLGFVLALEHEGVLYTRQAGFTRGTGSSSNFIYFNTLFYEMIAYAIDRGLRGIEYGTESFGAKLQRGCRLRAIESYVRSTSAAPEELSDYFQLYERAIGAYMVQHGVDPAKLAS